jgi:hypothetical protein
MLIIWEERVASVFSIWYITAKYTVIRKHIFLIYCRVSQTRQSFLLIAYIYFIVYMLHDEVSEIPYTKGCVPADNWKEFSNVSRFLVIRSA